MKEEKIITEGLGFPLEVTIAVGDFMVRGRHKTFTDERGFVEIGAEHRIEIKEGMIPLDFALVASHEAYHLFYSVRHLITVDEETEAEVFGYLVRRIHKLIYETY